MFLNFGLVVNAVLLVAGLLWCKEIFGRLRSDVDDLKESDDNIQKGVIVFFWVLTIIIVILIINFLWGLINNIVEFLR